MFCVSCGNRLDAEANFCGKCGRPRLETVEAPKRSLLGVLRDTIIGQPTDLAPKRGEPPIAEWNPSSEVSTSPAMPVLLPTDPTVADAFLAYERAFHSYKAMAANHRNLGLAAWCTANTHITIKNGLLSRWHENGDGRLFTQAQRQPVQKYLDIARDRGVTVSDEREIEQLERSLEHAGVILRAAIEAQLVAMNGDVDRVRAEMTRATEAFSTRLERVREETAHRNRMNTELNELFIKRQDIGLEEALGVRGADRVALSIEQRVNDLFQRLVTLASGDGKGYDTPEYIWVTSVRPFAKKAERSAAAAARRAEKVASLTAVKMSPRTPINT